MQDAKHDEEHTGHQRSDGETFEAILLDDAIYYNNERARRATNLYLRATEDRDNETCHDGCDDTFLGRHTRGDTKGNGQGQCHNTYNNTCQQVGHELLTIIML